MSKNEFLLDAVLLGVLSELHRTRGLRYRELKAKLNVSDSTLTNRLGLLKSHRLVKVVARSSETGRSYIVYRLTETGGRVVKELDAPNLLQKVSGLLPA